MSYISTYKGKVTENKDPKRLSNTEFAKDLQPGEAPDPKPDGLLTLGDVYG